MQTLMILCLLFFALLVLAAPVVKYADIDGSQNLRLKSEDRPSRSRPLLYTPLAQVSVAKKSPELSLESVDEDLEIVRKDNQRKRLGKERPYTYETVPLQRSHILDEEIANDEGRGYYSLYPRRKLVAKAVPVSPSLLPKVRPQAQDFPSRSNIHLPGRDLSRYTSNGKQLDPVLYRF